MYIPGWSANSVYPVPFFYSVQDNPSAFIDCYKQTKTPTTKAQKNCVLKKYVEIIMNCTSAACVTIEYIMYCNRIF